MAMRIPLIVSDVRALNEMVEEGRTALTHRAGDPESLAAGLIHLSKKPENRMRLAHAAYEFTIQNHT